MSNQNRHLEGGQSSRLPLTPSSSNLRKQKTPWRPKSVGSKENVTPQAIAAVKSPPLQSRVKRKLNLQKFTLNYPLSLPQIEDEDDSDVEMEIVDQDDHFALHSVETKERGDMDENQPQETLGAGDHTDNNAISSACKQVDNDHHNCEGNAEDHRICLLTKEKGLFGLPDEEQRNGETETSPSKQLTYCVDKKVDVGIQTLLPDHVFKGVEQVLAGAMKREMELEKLRDRQNLEIMHLKRMVQQHQHEREFNARISEMWKDQILRLENLLTTATYSAVSEEANEENNAEQRLEQERLQWAEAENRWITLVEELRSELQDSRALAEKCKQDLELEKKRSQMTMLEMARMLDQYMNLEEKHLDLLERNKTIQDGIEENVKKSPTKELLARLLFKKR